MPSGFRAVDWIVLAGYAAVVLAVGAWANRRGRSAGASGGGRADGDEQFLARRSMPGWAVAISVFATALSAATFVGGPQQAYVNDLTYLSSNVGMLLAVVIVALVFLPAYYRLEVTSIYELLEHRFGPAARRLGSAMFMIGRVFASGARLYMVAIPFALVAFGSLEPGAMRLSVVAVAVTAAAYTMLGGIRAVIWTDVLQAALLVATVAFALVVLARGMPAGPTPALDTLGAAGKLRVLDWSFDPRQSYTVWTAIIGFTLFGVAAFGTDQDLTQRMLTCRSARAGAWSTIASNLMSWPVVALFLAIGLLLFLRDVRLGTPAAEDSRGVFLDFILAEMPAGARGLMVAGLFAAAMSSLDSALSAMASTTIADFVRPWRERRHGATVRGDATERRLSRVATAGWAMVLAGFAVLCVSWQATSGQTLIDFALSVMVLAYGGLLGVFLCALLTTRGSEGSAVAGMLVGAAAAYALREWSALAFPWVMTVSCGVSCSVCMTGQASERMRSSALRSVSSSLQNAKRTSDLPSAGS